MHGHTKYSEIALKVISKEIQILVELFHFDFFLHSEYINN